MAAGLTIGVVVMVLFVAFNILWMFRHHQKKKKLGANTSGEMAESVREWLGLPPPEPEISDGWFPVDGVTRRWS
jgi:hypothetical protein